MGLPLQRQLGVVPAARPGISIGWPDAVDKDGLAAGSGLRRHRP
jgi:hypothetical protein